MLIGGMLNSVLQRQGYTSLARMIPCCFQKRNMSQKKILGEIKHEKGREFLDNMDAAMVEKKARMESWIEEMRHRGTLVPKVINEYDWKIILKDVNSRSALEKHCGYMFRRECSRDNEEAIREKKQKEREEKVEELEGTRSNHQFSLPYRKRDSEMEMWARLRGIRYGDPIILDMGYPEMKFREMAQAYNQFFLVIGENKTHRQPFHIHVTSVRDNTVFADNLDSNDCQRTMVDFHEKPFWELFPKKDLVYLTPDGPKLRGVNCNDIFVIGGIVDLHDSMPRTYMRAKELGIRMGSIPIHDYKLLVKGQGLRLPLPHIFGIMQEYCLNHDWEQALTKYLPTRHFLPKNKEGLRVKMESIDSSKQMKALRQYERELLGLKVESKI